MSKRILIAVSSRQPWMSMTYRLARKAGFSPILCRCAEAARSECDIFIRIGIPPSIVLVDGALATEERASVRELCELCRVKLIVIPDRIAPELERQIRDVLEQELILENSVLGRYPSRDLTTASNSIQMEDIARLT
ncbi:MAG: hypothetical protein JW941_08500 [Candidatus Coatesbacteria bacterium]|nr:hypothetical protein [Candidatus Coatesbacteria bacterium]